MKISATCNTKISATCNTGQSKWFSNSLVIVWHKSFNVWIHIWTSRNRPRWRALSRWNVHTSLVKRSEGMSRVPRLYIWTTLWKAGAIVPTKTST